MVIKVLILITTFLSALNVNFAETMNNKNESLACDIKTLPEIAQLFKQIETKHMNATKHKVNYELLLFSPTLAPESALKETAVSCYRYKLQLNKYLLRNNYQKSLSSLESWEHCWQRNKRAKVSYFNSIYQCLKKIKALKK